MLMISCFRLRSDCHVVAPVMKKVIHISLLITLLSGCSAKDWRTASREPAGIAPNPVITKDAVLHVYGAPAWGWRVV